MLLDKEALTKLSSSLDDDTLSYLCDALEETDTLEDAVGLIQSFLEDAGEDIASSDVQGCVLNNDGSALNADASANKKEEKTSATTPVASNQSAKASNTETGGTAASFDTSAKALNAPVVMQVQHDEHKHASHAQNDSPSPRPAASSKGKRGKRKGKGSAKQAARAHSDDSDTDGASALHKDDSAPKLPADNLIASSEISRFQRDNIGDSKEVHLRGIDIGYLNGPLLLQRAELRIMPNHRYGLLGRNGCGKSTFLRVLAERRLKNFPDHVTTLFIDQEARAEFSSVLQYVLAGDRELQALREEYTRITGTAPPLSSSKNQQQQQQQQQHQQDEGSGEGVLSPQGSADAGRLTEVLEEMELLSAATAEDRAREALLDLGFTEDMISSNSSALSGGWRMKAALARAVFCPPELLLLDEPTNHLDLHGVLWLQDFLNGLEDTCVIVVSHDRAFLDAVATDMLLIDKQQLTCFAGNFSAYLKDKEDKHRKHQRMYEAQEKKRQHIQASIDKGVQHARA